MVRLSITACLACFSATILAAPAPMPIEFDPAGEKNIGNAAGLQFVGGACLSSADCANNNVDKCCAFVTGVTDRGICSSNDAGVSRANGKAGCGFGDGGAAAAAPASAPAGNGAANGAADGAAGGRKGGKKNGDGASNQSGGGNKGANSAATAAPNDTGSANCAIAQMPGSQNVGTGSASQFITGQCLSAADCASGCCVLQGSGIGICKAQVLTQMQGLSCDFTCGAGSAPAVSNAAVENTMAAPPPVKNAAAGAAGACSVSNSLAGSQNVGTGAGTQFITGQCFSAADCASGCCVSQGGGLAICKARLVTEQAGLSCDFGCGTSNVVQPLLRV